MGAHGGALSKGDIVAGLGKARVGSDLLGGDEGLLAWRFGTLIPKILEPSVMAVAGAKPDGAQKANARCMSKGANAGLSY